MLPVGTPADVAAIAEAIARAPLVAFDLEFLAQERLRPTLCLVQVSWLPEHQSLDVPAAAIVATPPEVALVDPLAVDVAPLVASLAAHPCVVAHAARQDLGLLAAQFKATLPGLVDTQVMAAFAGVGDQVGLAALANELLGLGLGKEQQWTDWAARPLSDAQLAYADADVRHLPALYAKLGAQLGERLAWARAESASVAADAIAAASVTPETAWRQLGGLRGLDANALAAVVELAAWRLRVASELDRPLGHVLTDKHIIEVARQRPASVEELRSVKGLPRIARERAETVLGALAAARPEVVEVRASTRGPTQRAQRWSDILLTIAQVVGEEVGIATRLLATRAEAEEFARTVDERGLEAASSLPQLATWRRDVIGRRWVSWLAGTLAIVGAPTPAGVALVDGDG